MTNTFQVYSQKNNSLIRSVSVNIGDTIHYIDLNKKVNIDNSFKSVEIKLNTSDTVRYALVKSSDKDTLWHTTVFLVIKFKYLSPGSYSIIVHNTKTGQREAMLFHVSEKLWKKINFYVLYAVVLFLIIYSLYIYKSWSVIEENLSFKQKEITAIETARQKEELSIKNKNITDSINYARRIQLAMIPSIRYFDSVFPESFVLFKPKDIVSGDFFWITQKNDKIFVAAVDCTGHGVPGAFMSIIGIELLRKLVITQKIEEPAEVLNELNKNFAEIFKDVENITLRDGMDIAFCTIDKGSRILEFAGAFNPLYLIRDNKITEIKGDRFSVGLEDYENGSQSFTNHHIQLHKNDMIYIFTDGYSDQFGGPEGKKFKYRRFRHLLLSMHKKPLKEQRDYLEWSIEDWKGENDQVDDILIIGMKINF